MSKQYSPGQQEFLGWNPQVWRDYFQHFSPKTCWKSPRESSPGRCSCGWELGSLPGSSRPWCPPPRPGRAWPTPSRRPGCRPSRYSEVSSPGWWHLHTTVVITMDGRVTQWWLRAHLGSQPRFVWGLSVLGNPGWRRDCPDLPPPPGRKPPSSPRTPGRTCHGSEPSLNEKLVSGNFDKIETRKMWDVLTDKFLFPNSSMADTPDPLSSRPPVLRTVSQWAPTTTSLSPAVPQRLPGNTPRMLVPGGSSGRCWQTNITTIIFIIIIDL